jgi:ankyrin repeat protein
MLPIPREYIDYQDSNGNTLLHIVAKRNDVDTLMYLIGCGADKSIVNSNGMTPLMYAIQFNFTECARVLLNNGTRLTSKL